MGPDAVEFLLVAMAFIEEGLAHPMAKFDGGGLSRHPILLLVQFLLKLLSHPQPSVFEQTSLL
jgi:hypothetical protein